MASSASVFLPFLRPLAAPRQSTVRHFLQLSTSSRCCAAATREDPNLVASRTAESQYPPSSMKSLPRPKESRASHRTNHPKKKREYPTGISHQQPERRNLIPDPVIPLAPELCAPNLPYYVNRTSSNELPVYHLKKRAGSMLLTHVKKIDGSVERLRDELARHLGKSTKEVTINPLTKHIIIKGLHKTEVQKYLWERLF